MKVKIRSAEVCPVCGHSFKFSPAGLICPTHTNIKANTYYLDWFFQGERFRQYGYDSWRNVISESGRIDQELEDKERPFNAAKYKGVKSRVQKRNQFSFLYDRWLQQREKEVEKQNISPTYYACLKHYRKILCGFYKDEDVRTIFNSRINDLYHSLTGSAKYAHNIMSVMHKFLYDLRDENIIYELPKFPKIKVQKAKHKWLAVQDQYAVLDQIPEKHRAIFIFLFNTGCRPGEARAVTWDDIDLKNRSIRIHATFAGKHLRTVTKGKNERILPMSQELYNTLEKHPHNLATRHVFNIKGKPYGINRLSIVWASICKAVRCYQGTRHSFASQLVNNGVSLPIIGELLGHTDSRTTEIYSHVNMDATRAAVDGRLTDDKLKVKKFPTS